MMPTPPAAQYARPYRGWLRVLAAVWLVAFCLWFFTFDLPNGKTTDGSPVSRGDLWSGLSDILLENLFPTPNRHAPPSGWRFFVQRFDILAVAACILSAAWGLGHLILRGLALREAYDRPTRFSLAFGLGLSGLSLWTLGCGLLGWLSRGLFVGALLVMVAAEVACRLRERGGSEPRGTPGWWQRRWDVVPLLWGLSVLPFVLAMLLGALLPSIDFDVKEYHLEGPKEYYLQGHIGFLSHNVYTSFPFLTEMLPLLGMVLRDDWFRGALIGKTVLMSFAPLTAIGLFAAGRRWFGPSVGWLCVLMYLTTPWVYRISVIAYAEGGLTYYLFATLLAVLWLTAGGGQQPLKVDGALRPQGSAATGPSAGVSNQLVLCGLLAGSAVACKYPGVLSVAIPLGGFLLVWAWRQRNRPASTAREDVANPPSISQTTSASRVRSVVTTAGWFTLGTVMTFGPWMAKNVVETGNPVYPLLYPVFGGADWDAAAHRKWQNGHPPAIIGFLRQPATVPGNFVQRVVDVVAQSDWQSPLLFGAAPLAFFWGPRRRLVGGLWCYIGWLFLTWWALTHQLDRFWVPMLPVVALLSGAGWGVLFGLLPVPPADTPAGLISPDRRGGLSSEQSVVRPRCLDSDGEMQSKLRGGVNVIGVLLIASVALFNLGYVTTILCGYNAYLIDLDVARKEAMRVSAPGIALLDEVLPANARVLLVGEAQVFDATFDYAYNTVFDESLFERWTSAAQAQVPSAEQPLKSPEAIRQTFAHERITHVFVNWSEVLRYRETYGYTDYVTPRRFRELVAVGILEPMLTAGQFELYQVRSATAETRGERLTRDGRTR